MTKPKHSTDHVMLDLETVDTAPTAAIIAIGAVCFAGPNRGRKFYAVIDMQSSLDAGLTTTEDTIEWWGRQSDEARKIFTDPKRVDLVTGLKAFASYIDPHAKLWGDGAAFDNAILANAYRVTGVDQPWKFYNDRCYRTIKAGINAEVVRKGTHHNALDDAITQAHHLIKNAPLSIV